jgi:hypothetical protein
MHKIHTLLDQYAEHTIDDFSISTEDKQIRLKLSHDASQVDVLFDDVKTYLFLDEELQTVNIASNTPIHPISYYQNGYGEFITVEVNDQGESRESRIALPNFLLSFLDASMMLEAESIQVDGIRYSIMDHRH